MTDKVSTDVFDTEAHATLAVTAGTLALWLRDNPNALKLDNNKGDADEYGMHVIATSWLRLYYEHVKSGAIKLIKTGVEQ